jgi:hypothetical protein
MVAAFSGFFLDTERRSHLRASACSTRTKVSPAEFGAIFAISSEQRESAFTEVRGRTADHKRHFDSSTVSR